MSITFTILYYLVLIATPIIVGRNEVNEIKRWEWHTSQVWERLILIAFGLSVGLSAYGDWVLMVARILILAPVFWIIYDYVLYLYHIDGDDSTSVLNNYTKYKPYLLAVLFIFLMVAEFVL